MSSQIAALFHRINAEPIDFSSEVNFFPRLLSMFDYKFLSRIDRRTLIGAGICFAFVNACKVESMKASFDVVLFNYLNRPIFELLIDGTIDGSSDKYPGTGSGVMMGISLALGEKKVKWRLGGPAGMENNGDTVTSKNSPELVSIPGGKYLGIHVYPDYTVELIPSVGFPQVTERGQLEMAEAGRDHG